MHVMSASMNLVRAGLVAGALVYGAPTAALAQRGPTDTNVVVPITPPRTPLPAENATRGVTKFSFIAYGDTRGRHDGLALQAEHELVIESMLASIKRGAVAGGPIRFVLQSGDEEDVRWRWQTTRSTSERAPSRTSSSWNRTASCSRSSAR
jgi:hypothetical protein